MRIGLIGAGNMARALARGWGRPLLCSDPLSERAQALAAELGGEALSDNAEVAKRAEVVVLAHKPAQLRDVAAEIAPHARAVASILAATPLSALREAYGGATPVYRFLPALPAEVRGGAIVQAADPAGGGDEDLDGRVRALFAELGELVVETLAGTAELLRRRGYDTLAIRREVASPGGLTARGLDALERGGVRAAFSDALDAVLS